MQQQIKCPECASTDLLFSTKRQEYICEDCRHAFTGEQPRESLRILPSYGHDSNERLVRRIKTDLEDCGHDVWFDKSDIRLGRDWRRAITDGITHSDRVLSVLSEHSTRDPGVCLDEIGIAIGVKGGNIQTILVEAEETVQPPASISYIQWLDMHDWKERQAEGEESWNRWYDGKFAEIIRVVERDQSRRFAGEIEHLAKQLKPTTSDSRLQQLLRSEFVGRKSLLGAIENWRVQNRRSRLFCVVGDPGTTLHRRCGRFQSGSKQR